MEKRYKNIVLFFSVITAIVFIGFSPTYFSHFPNFEGFVNSKFSWQAGLGAFSYSKSEVPNVIN
jgi:hypothetical protein